MLNYISNNDKRFNRFVANRVSLICGNSVASQWRYVPSSLNPADHISRGVSIPKFLSLSDWHKGPPFLWQTEENWPAQTISIQEHSSALEIKKHAALATVSSEVSDPFEILCKSTNDWYTLRRHIAWFLRLKAILLKENPTSGKLRLKEIKVAEKELFKHEQKKHFTSTLQEIMKDRPASDKNMRKLKPFIDDNGLLRVGGRIENSDLNYEAKHPIILPKTSPIVVSLVNEAHKLLGHMGRSTMNCFLTKELLDYRIKFISQTNYI